ncbi:MAG: SUF system NifU family Fe-S cluster assembly protein [Microbacteriaceae bacterium]|nr:SUF system NifU family Fe-S cluster assembly protein [Microbacteriaceae bacterium]
MADLLAGLYQEIILDHSRRRSGDRVLSSPDVERSERNPTCGDEITVQIAFEPGSDRIAEVGWQGAGCSISMASASMLAEIATGLTAAELVAKVAAFREMMRSKGGGEPNEDVLGDAIAFHGTSKYVMRVKCAMLGWVAAEAAVGSA